MYEFESNLMNEYALGTYTVVFPENNDSFGKYP